MDSQSYRDLWEPILQHLSSYYSETVVNLWFRPLTLAGLNSSAAVLLSDNPTKCGIIRDRYLDVLEQVFEEVFGYSVRVAVVCQGEEPLDIPAILEALTNGEELPSSFTGTLPSPGSSRPKGAESSADSQAREPEDSEVSSSLSGLFSSDSFFGREYTFDTFIVGRSNQMAHATCCAVADNPANEYNPLFIYGQSGLGKTHLLYAIANRVRENNPSAKIVLVKGEAFTNELIEAIRKEQTAKFREKYRQSDVFLIDDVQFISGKEATQIEFFNTFNDLYEAKKQIILTSDRPPKEIKTLEDRLRSRFESGMVVDVQPPDMETRIAILRQKAIQQNLNIPNEVLNFLGESLNGNIRQIEGVIKKLGAYSGLLHQPINVEMAKEAIADIMPGKEPLSVTQDKIISIVSAKYGVSAADILGQKRNKDIMLARHVCIYIIRSQTDMSYPSIGRLFNRDHSTIMSSINTIEKRIQEDSEMESDIQDIIKEIKNM